MSVFLTILIISLLVSGIAVLFKLNSNRLEIYSDINNIDTSENLAERKSGLNKFNADKDLKTALTELFLNKKEETKRKEEIDLKNENPKTPAEATDAEVQLIKSMNTLFDAQKNLILDNIQSYLNQIYTAKDLKSESSISDKEQSSEPELLVVQSKWEPGQRPIMMSAVEEPSMLDETEELRRRASEKIAKLRSLTFNINESDPNEEFKTVPAYLRRTMKMNNQIADVQSFYSNYIVKSDEKNQADSTANDTFLEDKKPD